MNRTWVLPVVVGVVGATLFTVVYLVPRALAFAKIEKDMDKIRPSLQQARKTVQAKQAVEQEWNEVSSHLPYNKESETLNGFLIGLNVLQEVVDLKAWSTQPDRAQRVGDKSEFTEYAVDTTFQTSWESFVRLMLELHNWEGPLRVQRLTVTSRYEKENRLDVHMRVSTIELAPRMGGRP